MKTVSLNPLSKVQTTKLHFDLNGTHFLEGKRCSIYKIACILSQKHPKRGRGNSYLIGRNPTEVYERLACKVKINECVNFNITVKKSVLIVLFNPRSLSVF